MYTTTLAIVTHEFLAYYYDIKISNEIIAIPLFEHVGIGKLNAV